MSMVNQKWNCQLASRQSVSSFIRANYRPGVIPTYSSRFRFYRGYGQQQCLNQRTVCFCTRINETNSIRDPNYVLPDSSFAFTSYSVFVAFQCLINWFVLDGKKNKYITRVQNNNKTEVNSLDCQPGRFEYDAFLNCLTFCKHFCSTKRYTWRFDLWHIQNQV